MCGAVAVRCTSGLAVEVVAMSVDEPSSTSSRSRSRSKGAICFEARFDDGETRRVRVNQDVDPMYQDSIEQIERDARGYDDPLPDSPIAASGSRGQNCGDVIPALFCPDDNCGEVYDVGRTCRKSRCPRCWQSWDFHSAVRKAAKLQSLAKTRGSQSGRSIKKHHVTVSLRESTRFHSDDPLDRGFSLVKRLMQEVNVDTGYILYHPYRIKEEYRGDVNGHESGDGDMIWADILRMLESENWTWGAVKDEFLIYNPHFHVICLSEFVQTGDFNDDEGDVEEDEDAVSEWIEDESSVVIHRIVKNVKEYDSPVSMDGLDDLCAVMAYSLSHVALLHEEKTDSWQAAVRPFGEVANFEAFDNVEADVKSEMREVAPDVLGVDFAKPRCSAHVVDEDDEQSDDEDALTPESSSQAHVAEADESGRPPAIAMQTAASGGGVSSSSADWSSSSNTGFERDDSWAESSGYVPDFTRDPSEVSEKDGRECGTPLVPMWAADEYLEDEDWMDTLSPYARRQLREKYAEWVALGCPEPEDVTESEDPRPPPD